MARHNGSSTHQSPRPRRSPRRSSLPPPPPPPPQSPLQPTAPGGFLPLPPTQPNGQQVERPIEAYNHRSSPRKVNTTRAQCRPLYFRTVPEQFSPFVNPFVNDAIWSFTPRSGVARTSTLGRKVGDIHWSFVGGRDATFYVCVASQNRLKWVTIERGYPHPLYPTHVLYQREKSAPRWILARTFCTYVRMYGI